MNRRNTVRDDIPYCGCFSKNRTESTDKPAASAKARIFAAVFIA
jgi:hypothetical protein